MKDTDPEQNNIAGGKPTKMNLPNPEKHQDDTDLPLQDNLKDAEEKSEQENMSKKRGYNETPPDVPVKSKDSQ